MVTIVNNYVYQVAYILHLRSAMVSYTVAAYVEQTSNPAYGSYWAFGVIMVIVGFILIARGDRKRSIPRPKPILPISTEPPL
jgi:hypothetical protein